MLDLLVIGAGLTGLTAAYTAAKSGLRVKVIAKGLGAMHWGAGTLDILGYLPGEEGAVKRPLAAISQLPDGHPYRLAGDVAGVLATFVALTEEIGLPFQREVGRRLTQINADSENLLLPSPVGAARPAFAAPVGQLGGDLSRPEPMLIVGFTGLRDFYPQLIAENLTRQGYPARAAFLPLAVVSGRRDNTAVSIARELDNPDQRQKLAQALRPLLKPGERVGLPAILGLDDHMQALADLQGLMGTAVFEIPTLPPSVPGMRLFRALEERLQRLGVRVEVGMEVTGANRGWRPETRDSQSPISNLQSPISIEWVETETSARPLKHRARAFLLATGGILGGGFESDVNGRVWEPIFNLPLTAPQKRSGWFRPAFLDPQGHPVFNGGVAVSPDFRPVDGAGRPLFANVWAAGGLLANFDPILERSLSGTAVVTGMAAAQAIVEHVKCEP